MTEHMTWLITMLNAVPDKGFVGGKSIRISSYIHSRFNVTCFIKQFEGGVHLLPDTGGLVLEDSLDRLVFLLHLLRH